MYGTKELNARRADLLKHFKGKYFAPRKNGKSHIIGKVFQVTDVIVDFSTNSMKLVFVEIGVKTKCNSFAGSYRELVKVNKALYCGTKLGFKRNFRLIMDKEECFKLAEMLD